MSWPRGSNNNKSTAQSSSENDLESQNDSHLNDLHSKLQLLRGVTTDIYRDSQSQNGLLDTTTNTFNSFQGSLANTTSRFARSVQSGQGQGRLQLSVIGGIISLFFLYKLFY